ncbi:hypothetical protein [Streptomyces sp. ok210]|nr:hypothetical protein [Streptomyces sp. ok210]SFT22340.1 hypothetical protein SAMN04487982_110196 [Streptomyces sp. ok210]
MFDTYVKLGFDLPALIPQVYFHYDPPAVGAVFPASGWTSCR